MSVEGKQKNYHGFFFLTYFCCLYIILPFNTYAKTHKKRLILAMNKDVHTL